MSERDMTRLIAILEKRLGVQWADVVEWLRTQNTLDAIEAKLVNGQLDDVVAEVTTAAEKFAAEVQHAYVEAGTREAVYLDSKLADTLVHFDSAYPSVVARAKENTLEQVYGLNAETRENVRTVLTEGIQAGAAPRETARRIRDSIGLTPQQERQVTNYRGYLERGEWSKALSHELSSGNVDRTIRRLQRDGGSMTSSQIDRAVEERRANGIAHRAETIARTETLGAAHGGSHDAVRQAITRGDVEADQLQKDWLPGPKTKHAREDHQAMGRRDSIPFLQDYVLPDGTLMAHPGDKRGGAKHCANCRCTEAVTLVSLE